MMDSMGGGESQLIEQMMQMRRQGGAGSGQELGGQSLFGATKQYGPSFGKIGGSINPAIGAVGGGIDMVNNTLNKGLETVVGAPGRMISGLGRAIKGLRPFPAQRGMGSGMGQGGSPDIGALIGALSPQPQEQPSQEFPRAPKSYQEEQAGEFDRDMESRAINAALMNQMQPNAVSMPPQQRPQPQMMDEIQRSRNRNFSPSIF